MDPIEIFAAEVNENICKLGASQRLPSLTFEWMYAAGTEGNYTYNFKCLGRPIIQFPQDMVGLQELIWEVKPDLIIETGIAHGGSLILSASMLAMLDYCDAVNAGRVLDPKQSKRKVIGLDIDIRAHNRAAIESHPMAHKIEMIQGSSIDKAIVAEVHKRAVGYERVLVCLDSNHTHEHVLAELEAYAPLASVGSYCVVFDTLVEHIPSSYFVDRPWGPGNSPMTAVHDYLKNHSEFEIDKDIQHKLLITVAPDGWLKRVS